MKIFSIFKRTEIRYNNSNPMWNNGYIYVYVKGEIAEVIDVDEELDKDNDFYSAYCIIDFLKSKYGIKKVVEKVNNWR